MNHYFDTEVALKFGVNAAIIIANLSHLQANRKAQGGDKYYIEGRWYVHHSYESMALIHPYFSVQQIRRIMRKLLEQKAVFHCTPDKWNRTSYWSVASEFSHVSESTDACVEIDSSQVSKSTVVLHNYNIEQRKVFKPPLLEEVAEYCKERNNSVNAESFINHYEANGWMRGKSKVKCWRACVRTWEKNAKPLDNGGGYV